MCSITIRPVLAKDLKPGDVFRAANDRNFKIKNIDWTDEVVEIEYYTGTQDYFVSFFVAPARIIDVIEDSDTEHKPLIIRPTNGTNLVPEDRIRLNGTLYDVIDNQIHAGENLMYELTIREGLTNESQTIEYISGTIFDVLTDIREED